MTKSKRVRHKVRGTEYTIIGVGRAQGEILDDDPVVLYRDDNDGGLWARHQAEFSDGRFEYIKDEDTSVEHGPKCWGKTSYSDEMLYCYCDSKDQHSGGDEDKVRRAVEALERGIKRCETYEHIRLGGRSETAKKAGTLRNAMGDMREALAALKEKA